MEVEDQDPKPFKFPEPCDNHFCIKKFGLTRVYQWPYKFCSTECFERWKSWDGLYQKILRALTAIKC